jgi:hypothetical protein
MGLQVVDVGRERAVEELPGLCLRSAASLDLGEQHEGVGGVGIVLHHCARDST